MTGKKPSLQIFSDISQLEIIVNRHYRVPRISLCETFLLSEKSEDRKQKNVQSKRLSQDTCSNIHHQNRHHANRHIANIHSIPDQPDQAYQTRPDQST